MLHQYKPSLLPHDLKFEGQVSWSKPASTMTLTAITLTTSQRACYIPEALMGSRAVTCSPYIKQCGRCHDSVKHKIIEWVGMVHPSINSDCDTTATNHVLPEVIDSIWFLYAYPGLACNCIKPILKLNEVLKKSY